MRYQQMEPIRNQQRRESMRDHQKREHQKREIIKCQQEWKLRSEKINKGSTLEGIEKGSAEKKIN